MAYIAPGWPAVYTGLRGICYAEITVRTARSDLHSGEFGGAAPNAHEELARLLGRLKTPDGKIHVPGLYAAVARPTKRELAAWKRLPFKESDFLKRRGAGQTPPVREAHFVLGRGRAPPPRAHHSRAGGVAAGGGGGWHAPAAAAPRRSPPRCATA